MSEYYSQDITFCSKRNCANKNCERNRCHIRWDLKPYHSFADFENTQYCRKTTRTPKKARETLRMNNSEIMKALECCCEKNLKNYTCGECPLENEECFGGNVLKRYALDLINRQKAEIIAKTEGYNDMLEQRNKCEAEIVRFTNAYKQCAWERDAFLEELKTAKSEAIKEFARELKCGVPQETGVIRCKDVDNLVKEMESRENTTARKQD